MLTFCKLIACKHSANGNELYPIARLTKEILKFRNAPKTVIYDVHTSTHICRKIDIDMFGVLNNGRTLMLYDLGRLVTDKGTGLMAIMRKKGWRMTLSGVFIRSRHSVKVFQKYTMKPLRWAVMKSLCI